MCLARVTLSMSHRENNNMRVKELMTSDVKSCGLDTNLAAAAKIMWEEDCGAVPVTDAQGQVVGMITDRDICIAGATRSRGEGEIPVGDVISKTVYTCAPSDDARSALETMRHRRIRRLPVVDQSGRLNGILSLHDIAAQARSSKGADVPADVVLDTYLAITATRGLPVHA
jgi:CBS domain-containing protein